MYVKLSQAIQSLILRKAPSSPCLISSSQFLKRNSNQRIGGGPGDAADVQVGRGQCQDLLLEHITFEKKVKEYHVWGLESVLPEFRIMRISVFIFAKQVSSPCGYIGGF